MPVIKSAKKRMRQNLKRRARNYPLRSEMKTYVKKVLDLAKKGDAAELAKVLPKAYSVIDMAVKKNIIHANNGARKKSLLARALNKLEAGSGKAKAEAKPAKEAAKPEKAEKEEVAEKTEAAEASE